MQAVKLQFATKDFLRSVQQQGELIEYGAAYTMDMKMVGQQQSGKVDNVDIPDLDKPYIGIHNHPNGGPFSEGDVTNFINRPNLQVLVAVGNDGTVYALHKTEGYDYSGFLEAFTRELPTLTEIVEKYRQGLYSKEEGVAKYAVEMERFLREEAKQYGVEFIPRA